MLLLLLSDSFDVRKRYKGTPIQEYTVTNVKVQRKDVLSQEEISEMLKKAEELPTKYFQLRAKALVSIFRSSKRRGEVNRVELNDITQDSEWLYITFSVEKKRKKNIFSTRVQKKFKISNKYAQHILTYKRWLETNVPKCRYLFPSGHSVFGQGYIIYGETHLNGRELLRIIKWLNPKAWCHLFRETGGAEQVKHDEGKYGQATLETAFRVQRKLDLARVETALRYVQRYETQKVELEEEMEE